MRVFGHFENLAAAGVCAFGLFLAGTALADEACGTCDKEIVTTQELADCFLDQYDQLAQGSNAAILIDLSACPQSRGVVEALAGPAAGAGEPVIEPSLRFMLSRTQLACLKRKLEDPAVELDPSAKIELESCG
ncbi:hypothetical protein ACSBOB_31960 [Mesorhizobium sp. ASY16-5R]|uniref:hypothetical protein n=1 Tax=Mesorhizobium sp. ASY16-5R TaxID=3445772 RepID=UPI003FA0EB53